MTKKQGLAWTLFITIVAMILILAMPVDATPVSLPICTFGESITAGGAVSAELGKPAVSYDMMKHLPSFTINGEPCLDPKGAKKGSVLRDLVINLRDQNESDILRYAIPGYGIRNNKKVSTEKKSGLIYIKLKAKKDAPADKKAAIAALNREMKAKPFEFRVEKADLSKFKLEIEKKPDGSVKNVFITVEGNRVKLSKKDYTVSKSEDGAIVINGQGSFAGTYKEGKSEETPKPSNDDSDDIISTASDNGIRRIMAGLNVDLLKSADIQKEIKDGVNVAVSSYSIENAMGMTANGAKGETLTEMETALFGGNSIADFNKMIKDYNAHVASLQADGFETNLANGIWVNGLKLNENFKKAVTDNYGAGISDSVFDGNTAGEINGFVSKNTKGMIPKIIDEADSSMTMILVNALYLQGVWDETFNEDNILEDQDFTDFAGNVSKVTMLRDSEASRYFSYNGADGIMKNLKEGNGKFIAILPKEGTDLADFINSMDADVMARIEDGFPGKCQLVTLFPEFEYEYEVHLPAALSALGVKRAFTGMADFSGNFEDENVSSCIDDVIHKTHVKVDREGAKAAAATAVVEKATSVGPDDTLHKYIVFDRPFVYMLTDDNNVPLFLGTVSKVK